MKTEHFTENGECQDDCSGCHWPGRRDCPDLSSGCDICQQELDRA